MRFNLSSMGATVLIQIALLFNPYVAYADADAVPASIKVTGYCVRSAQPDQVEVSIGVLVRQADAGKAAEVASVAYEKLLKKIKALNLKNAEYATTSMNVSRVYDYENNKQVLKGYDARYAFRVISSDLSRTGEIFKIAKENGANEVQGPYHRLSKKLFQHEYEACLDEAAQNARVKAEVISKSLSVKLDGRAIIEELEDGAMAYDQSRTMMMAEASFASKGAATVEAKNEDVKVTLRGQFFVK